MRPANLTSWRHTGDEGRLDRAATFRAGFKGRPAGCGGRGGDTCARCARRRLRWHDRPWRLSEPHADRTSPPALDHALERRRGCRSAERHQGRRDRRQDPAGDGENRRRPGRRHAQCQLHRLAQPRHARRRHALQGPRHGDRPDGPDGHGHEHVPHAHAAPDVRRADLRGLPPDLRRRHAHHAHLQPADHRSPGRRESARAVDLEAGGRGLVLGRRHHALVPAARLLAAAHQSAPRRAPERRRGRARRLRHAHPHPELRDRPLADRRGQHADAHGAHLS